MYNWNVNLTCRSADRELLTAWEGCKEYYFHSIALLAQLRAAIAKPHKDIGPPIIERCKGFTMHLMVSRILEFSVIYTDTRQFHHCYLHFHLPLYLTYCIFIDFFCM